MLPALQHGSSFSPRNRHAKRARMEVPAQPPAAGSKLIQGPKPHNEDTLTSVPDLLGDYHYYSVFDGHGGPEVSEYCASHLHNHLLEQLTASSCDVEADGRSSNPQQERRSLEGALTRAFAATDAQVAATVSNSRSCGSTACVAIVTDSAVVVANCGDSRAVLVRGGQPVPLSQDHRPSRQDEADRVLAAGGQILWNSGSRVMGILACTRSIGDRDLQPFGISSTPEILYTPRTDDDEFMVLATDGVWNVLENDAVCGMIQRCLKRAADKNATRASAFRMAADVAGRMAKDKGSRDDIAVVVVDLAPMPGSPPRVPPLNLTVPTGGDVSSPSPPADPGAPGGEQPRLSASLSEILAGGTPSVRPSADGRSSGGGGGCSTAVPPPSSSSAGSNTVTPRLALRLALQNVGGDWSGLAAEAGGPAAVVAGLAGSGGSGGSPRGLGRTRSLAAGASLRGVVDVAEQAAAGGSSTPVRHASCGAEMLAVLNEGDPRAGAGLSPSVHTPCGTPRTRLAIRFALQDKLECGEPEAPSALKRTRSVTGPLPSPRMAGVVSDGGGAAAVVVADAVAAEGGPVRHLSCSAEIVSALSEMTTMSWC